MHPSKSMRKKRTRISVFIISIISITACISFLNLFLNIHIANFDLNNQSYLGDDGIDYESSSLRWNPQNEQKTLQFLHIAKTGGSAVTDSALDANIGWGYCQFRLCPGIDFSSKKDSGNYINRYEEYQIKQRQNEVQKLKIADNQKYLWHYPSSIVRRILALPSENNDHNDVPVLTNPYEGADLFVVVRNPYDRIISLYYHWELFYHPLDKTNSVGLMNRLVGEMFDEVKKDYFFRCGHYILQYDFVYDTSSARKIRIGTVTNNSTTIDTDERDRDINNWEYRNIAKGGHYKKLVKHIIHFENLSEEFDALMKRYNMNITLQNKASSKRKRSEKATITKYDLSEENRQRIESFYAKDFEEFGYPIMTKMES